MLSLHSNDRTSLFIDGSNLNSAARALAIFLDYARILKHFKDRTRLIRAYYYIAVPENVQGNSERIPIRPLVDWLDYNGYHLISKPTKQYEDPFGNLRTKGNMDVELSVDMVMQAPHLDHIILFSGDGDFRRLVEACQQYCKVSVISTTKSSPPMCSDDLRRQADDFTDLADLKLDFQRTQDRYIGLRTSTGGDSNQPDLQEGGEGEEEGEGGGEGEESMEKPKD